MWILWTDYYLLTSQLSFCSRCAAQGITAEIIFFFFRNQQWRNTEPWNWNGVIVRYVLRVTSVFCSPCLSSAQMMFTGATVLLMGFVVGCTNNNLCVSKTTSAVHGQPNAFIQWVFGSFVSRVWDTLGCGCPWESCHCPVLWDYTHVRTHSDRWAASSAAEHQNSVKPQNHTALFLWDVCFFAHSSSFCEPFQQNNSDSSLNVNSSQYRQHDSVIVFVVPVRERVIASHTDLVQGFTSTKTHQCTQGWERLDTLKTRDFT